MRSDWHAMQPAEEDRLVPEIAKVLSRGRPTERGDYRDAHAVIRRIEELGWAFVRRDERTEAP